MSLDAMFGMQSVTYFYFPNSNQISEAQWLRAGEMPNRGHY